MSPHVMLIGGMIAGALIGFGLGMLYHRYVVRANQELTRRKLSRTMNSYYGKLGSGYGGGRYEELKPGSLVTTDVSSKYPEALLRATELRCKDCREEVSPVVIHYCKGECTEYIVEKGDSWFRIAQKYGQGNRAGLEWLVAVNGKRLNEKGLIGAPPWGRAIRIPAGWKKET